MAKKIISLLGCRLDTGNMGVSALAASLTKLFSEKDENVIIRLLIGHTDSEPQLTLVGNKQVLLSVVNHRFSFHSPFHQHILGILLMSLLYRFLPLKAIRKKIMEKNTWIRTIIESGFIGDIQGGDSFSDIYGLKLFIRHCLPLLIIILLKKEFTLLPQTYGPYQSKIAKALAGFIILKADRVFSRDKEGFEYLKTLLKNRYPAVSLIFCPDVAFTMDPQAIERPLIQPPLPLQPKLLIGLNINGLMYAGGYNQKNMFNLELDYRVFTLELIKQLLTKNRAATLLLIPHTFGNADNVNSDPYACQRVLEEIAQTVPELISRIHFLKSEHNQHELKSLVGTCHFFIGSRMHACIAALSQGIPAIGVAYSRKFIGVFNSIGLGHLVIDARYCDNLTAINKVEELLQVNTQERKSQKYNVEKAKEQIYNIFTKLVDEIEVNGVIKDQVS